MSPPLDAVRQYLQDHADRNVGDLCEFLKIPSISADSKYRGDVRRAAEWVRDQLAACGCDVELVETAGHPIVFGSICQQPNAPTVLVYGHYDVQPPDPLDKWQTPPFEPDIRDGHVYARGATDDKGQMLTHVKSVQAWKNAVGDLPVNVKFVIEGEEEVGSNNLEIFLEEQRDRCSCDIAVVSDTAQYGPGIPAITYGLRGIVACEVTLTGPRQDLHSGVFGGSIANPVNALCSLIGKLVDDEGLIQIPGFYDDVLPLTDEERQAFDELPFNEQDYLGNLGMSAVFGETGYTTLERRWARPTCDVNGIIGGYTGEGPKTIVPSFATAKISCRLVPNQDAEQVVQSLEQFLRDNCLPGLELSFTSWHGCEAVLCDTSSSHMAAAQAAIETAFGKAPVMIREGGSIPVVATFKKVLNVDTLLLGWGQNTDNLHSPNEKFSLEAFHQGTLASACLWHELVQHHSL
ncbi:MAG: dipeptidase [Planctomycetaceae bacterium]|nr:dipeptidase [Planctomycetaceae bacterium]